MAASPPQLRTGSRRAPAERLSRGPRSGAVTGPGPVHVALLAVALASCGRDGPSAPAAGEPPPSVGSAGAPAPRQAPSDEELEARYRAARDVLAGGAPPSGAALERVRAELEQVANLARDKHLRANGALLLGSLEEQAGRTDRAVALYRHAATLVPDDAGPHMALALALSGAKRWAEAAEAQLRAAKLDPDNLENWLLLGEMRTKGGDKDGAVEAYAAYELRRKGLLDGLTLKGPGADGAPAAPDGYRLGPEDRARCALALSIATDQGTARGLLYALASEPDPRVRAAIVEAMGLQRLADYIPPLEARKENEPDPAVRAAIERALAEIRRAPVKPRAEGARELPAPAPLREGAPAPSQGSGGPG